MSSKYIDTSEKIKHLIEKNIEQKIYKLPTEKELCAMFEVSKVTLRHSLLILEENGYITRRRGSGIYATGYIEKHNNVALLLQSDIDYFYPALITELSSSLSSLGFICQAYITHYNISEETRFLKEMLSLPPRLLVIDAGYGALSFYNEQLYLKLISLGTQIVLFNTNYQPSNDFYLPLADENNMAATLSEKLLLSGHKKIACLFEADNSIEKSRCRGCYSVLHNNDHIFWCTKNDIINLRQNRNTIFFRNLLNQIINSDFSAIICGSDELAFYLTKEAVHMGINIPSDLFITGFGNSHLTKLTKPHIPTIHYEKSVATTITDIATALLTGKSAEPFLSCSYTLSDSFR